MESNDGGSSGSTKNHENLVNNINNNNNNSSNISGRLPNLLDEKVYNETTFISEIGETIPMTRSNGKNGIWQWRRNIQLKHRKRQKEKNSSINQNVVPMDKLNCFQFVFFTWMTPLIRRIFRRKITIEHLGLCSPFDSCEINSSWLNTFWIKECDRSGLHNASLISAIFKFIRFRFLLSCTFYVFCLAAGYLSSTFFLNKLLKELEYESFNVKTGNDLTNTDGQMTDCNDEMNGYSALKWTIALYICELFRAISFSIMFAISIRTGIRCVNGLNGILYRKILTRSQCLNRINEMGKKTAAGSNIAQPENLYSNDLWKVFQMIYMAPSSIGSPIIILMTIIYTYLLIGTSAIFGILLFIIIFLLQLFIIKRQTNLRKKSLKQTDHRIFLINQLVKKIRTIKLNNWEKPFQTEIEYCRLAESNIIKKYHRLQCISTSLALLTPMLVTIFNILIHTWMGNNLAISTAFSLLMLNYIAAHGIRALPNYLREFTNGNISLKRIERFLQLDDRKLYLMSTMLNEENAIEMINCSFFWSNQNNQKMLLSKLNLCLAKKDHICLYGPVGSGKSTLLLSIMGQTHCSMGELRVFSERIAYVSQKPWLQNATIKENILFGLPYDEKRYYKTLVKCSLVEDIDQWEYADDTIVGENGAKLSGGQKHRISLARAVYSDSDIYLIDDCFSSLDTKVLKNTFNSIIKEVLQDKTVIFVTRQLYLLDNNDLVIMINDGQISQPKKHSTLLEESEDYRTLVERSKITQNNDSSEVVKKMDENMDINSEEESDSEEENNTENDDQINEKLRNNFQSKQNSSNSLKSLMKHLDSNVDGNNDNDNDVEAANGQTKLFRSKYFFTDLFCPRTRTINKNLNLDKESISWSVYKKYINASGGWLMFSFLITVFFIQMPTCTFSNFWLSYWLKQGSGNGFNTTDYEQNSTLTNIDKRSNIIDNPNLHFYQLVYLILFFVVIGTSIIMAIVFVRIVTTAANTVHRNILVKVIHSPLIFFDSIQIGKIINLFTHNMDELDNQLPVAIEGFFQRILLVMGNFIIIFFTLYWSIIPLIIFCIAFYIIFRYYRKAMYWLKMADMRLRSPIYSYLNTTIDGLITIKAFRSEILFENNFAKLCNAHAAAKTYHLSAIRWLSIRIDFICILISFLVTLFIVFNAHTIGTAYAGLVITQSLQLSGLLQLVVRLTLDVETRLISMERISTYIRLMKKEQSILVKNTKFNKQELFNNWPMEKIISFRNVSLRYRNNSSLVLKSISFEIKDGQTFAIVGRTGAGKTSITNALFRLIEICSGEILIDNINIQSIPLNILRSKLSIIPQDPVIFKRSVRNNLDPWLKTKDDKLWQVLEQVKLKEKILSFKDGLEEIIDEEKLSTGEKQLLCLARAILKCSKIVVLDEATSSVDDKTENDIWDIVKKSFDGCTLIIIAHRLQTVQKCDQLIVMKNGTIIEQGNPVELKRDPNSYFSKMISIS